MKAQASRGLPPDLPAAAAAPADQGDQKTEVADANANANDDANAADLATTRAPNVPKTSRRQRSEGVAPR